MLIKVLLVVIFCGLLYIIFNVEHQEELNVKPLYPAIYATILQEWRPIPKTLFITYKNISAIPALTLARWKYLNPDYEVKLYDDKQCSETMSEIGPWAEILFNRIKDGPIKADLWRVAILYLYGGVYVDVDSFPLLPIKEVLKTDTTFCTSMSYPIGTMNPMFIASTERNPILRDMLRVYETYIMKIPYSYWGYSIVYVAADVMQLYTRLDNVPRTVKTHNQTIVLLAEKSTVKKPWFWQSIHDYDINLFLETEKMPFIRVHTKAYDMIAHKFT